VLLFAVGVVRAVRPAPPPHDVVPALAVDDPAFVTTLEGHVTTPVTAGNRVSVLVNGEAIFPAKLAAIRRARTSITYAEYFWGEGEIGREVAEALAERCRAGVAVKVLLDGVGTLNMPDQHQAALRRAGCRVYTFRPLARLSLRRHNNRNHRRILVIDGRIGQTGGSGVSDKWTGNGTAEDHWHDVDVHLEGPAVQWLQSAFAENWREVTHEVLGGAAYFPVPPTVGDVRVQVIASSPAAGSYAAYTMALLAMAGARRSILITNPYFVLDDQMTGALLSAAHRGVRVRVLTPGKIDHNLVRSASRRDYGALLQGGVEIFEYQASLLHAKTMVVDGTWATVGSTNFDNRSFALSDELNVGIHDRAIARRLEELFEQNLTRARRIDYESWRTRGLRERLTETLVLPIRDLL
jgi:cardiolipin synthase